MKKCNLILLVFTLIMSACSKSDDPIIDLPDPIKENAVVFSDLKVGQTSQYLRYETTCADYRDDFHFTGDTLVVEVKKENGALYLKEYFTEKSPMYINGANTPITYPIESNGTVVNIPERFASRLFYFYGSDDINLKPANRVNLKQIACKLNLSNEPFVGNEIGKVSEFKVGEIKVKNKTAVSCVPMIDLDGYLLYDEHQLFMSHTIIIEEFNGNITDFISGWVLN